MRSAFIFQWPNPCGACGFEMTLASDPGTTVIFSYLNNESETATTNPSCRNGQPTNVHSPIILEATSSVFIPSYGFRICTTIDLFWLSEPWTFTPWYPGSATCGSVLRDGNPARASVPRNTPSQRPGMRCSPSRVGRSNGSILHVHR